VCQHSTSLNARRKVFAESKVVEFDPELGFEKVVWFVERIEIPRMFGCVAQNAVPITTRVRKQEQN
jgi:hypothetical protein